jgi:hypothetical protein
MLWQRYRFPSLFLPGLIWGGALVARAMPSVAPECLQCEFGGKNFGSCCKRGGLGRQLGPGLGFLGILVKLEKSRFCIDRNDLSAIGQATWIGEIPCRRLPQWCRCSWYHS